MQDNQPRQTGYVEVVLTMKTKQDFIEHLINNYYIQRHIKNDKVHFEIFSKTYKTFVDGVYMSDNYCALINNAFLYHPDFKYLFTADIITELVMNNKIETYTDYELTQNI